MYGFDDHSHQWSPIFPARHRDAHRRQTVYEIHRPVQGIDYPRPAFRWQDSALFLSHYVVGGPVRHEHPPDLGFHPTIHLGNRIHLSFELDLGALPQGLSQQRGGPAGRGHGQGQIA